MQLLKGLEEAVKGALAHGRPILTHLNADTSWLLSLPYPATHPAERKFFHVLIDPWLKGPQSDLASWFSRQWHAIDSSVQTVAELNSCLENLENIAVRCKDPTSTGPGTVTTRCASQASSLHFIDIVVISHEFTDHCNRATLQEITQDTPIFATEAAARLISSWKYFRHVHSVASLSSRNYDWRKTSSGAIPQWLGISRIITKRDRLHLHSGILVTFKLRSNLIDESCEGIIYTPHGIHADSLQSLSLASPRIHILALLHGLHDIKLSVKQLNLGAHNALRAQRICEAKYWLSTHDEVKRAGGLVHYFLKRKIWTFEDVLQAERVEDRKASTNSPSSDMREVHFSNLESGGSLLLM